MKRVIKLFFTLVLIILISIIFSCAKHRKVSKLEFKPTPVPEVPSRELPPQQTLNPILALQVAGEYFNEAKQALANGNKKLAVEKYITARRTLISGGIVPSIFYELDQNWEPLLPQSERKIDLSSLNTYKVVNGLKGRDPYDSIRFPFPVPEEVIFEIQDAQNRYPDRFQEGLDRSGLYVPYIKNAFAKAGLPEEFCWLAMVESMYKTRAYSHAGAAGMWQFIRSTGERFDLKMDAYIDERYNWIKSTESAIQYLKRLHDFFNGSWELAISAYNMGEGGLRRAIEANGGDTNFWTLIKTPPASYRIKDETKKYYPRFLAYILICNDPVPYGFSPPKNNPLEWDELQVTGLYSLDTLDQYLGLEGGTLAQWNPHLIRKVTHPTGCTLILPKGKGVQLAKLIEEGILESVSLIAYTVKKGESAHSIAKKFDVSVNELLSCNSLPSFKSIKPGVTLYIPRTKTKEFNFARNANIKELNSNEKSHELEDKYHVVQEGDTLHKIAKKYRVSIDDLQRWNNLNDKCILKVGQRILIQGDYVPSNDGELKNEAETTYSEKFYIVQKGDTLSKIAREHNTSVRRLLEDNDLNNASDLKIGQKLKISLTSDKNNKQVQVDRTSQKNDNEKESRSFNKIRDEEIKRSLLDGQTIIYTIQKGDSLWIIAKKHNVDMKQILELNPHLQSEHIKVGEKIKIPRQNTFSNQNDMENEKKDMVAMIDEAVKLRKVDSGKSVNGNSKNKTETSDKVSSLSSNKIEKDNVYIVQKGDSPYVISKKTGIPLKKLFEINGWDDKKVLKIGEKVVLE